jgi:hypothetical protein
VALMGSRTRMQTLHISRAAIWQPPCIPHRRNDGCP